MAVGKLAQWLLSKGLVLLLIAMASSCKILPEIEPVVYDETGWRSTQGIERDLEYLTYGLAMAHHELYDTLAGGQLYNPVSNIMFRKATMGVTDYYAVTYTSILNEAEALGIELDSMMNDYIRAEFNIPDTSNLVRLILANNYHNGTNYSFHIVFPYLDNYVNLTPDSITELIPMTEAKFAMLNSKRPVWTWSYTDKSYPLDGYGVTGLGSWEELGDVIPSGLPRPVAVSSFMPLELPLYFDALSEEDFIFDCTTFPPACKECPLENTNEPLESIGGGPGLGFDEIEFVLGDLFEGCFETQSIYTELNNNTYYAKVVALPGYQYYYVGPSEPNKSALILNNPLYSNYSNDYGWVLTFCNSNPIMKVIGEGFGTGGGEYWIGRGGVYELIIPGVSNDPVYFSFPFAELFWYFEGPDMRIFAELEKTPFNCYLDVIKAAKNYSTQANNFYSNNIIDPLNTRYIITTDKSEIEAFWKDNWFYLGLSNSSTILPLNSHAFEAIASPDSPIIPSDLGDEIVRLETGTGALPPSIEGGYLTEKFEIVKEFTDGITYSSGTQFYLYLAADYENGESIEEYRLLTFEDTEDAAEIRAFFRGQIETYTAILYEVD